MTDAEWLQFQELAAGYARSCDIATAADKLVAIVDKALRSPRRTEIYNELKAALEAYKVVRNGQ